MMDGRWLLMGVLAFSAAAQQPPPSQRDRMNGLWKFPDRGVWIQVYADGSAFQCRVRRDGSVIASRGAVSADAQGIQWEMQWGLDQVRVTDTTLSLSGQFGAFEFVRSQVPMSPSCGSSTVNERPGARERRVLNEAAPPADVSAGVVEAPAPTSFESAQRLAQRDEANPDSHAWREQAVGRLGNALLLVVPCMEAMGFANVPTVNVVVRLSAQGHVTQVFAQEDSAYAQCVKERLPTLDLGSAPWDGYWYEIRLLGT